MFIGHFAVGFAGKRATPRASFAALLFAALFADVLWPVLVAIGAAAVAARTSLWSRPLEFRLRNDGRRDCDVHRGSVDLLDDNSTA